ncbi:MAG: branched-chain amino acid ABC transporter permease [Actinobacteria bacterium]|nr:branched-chain amino acid ABC transporter permease [Actinomycetota bacterium]MCZ6631093.1 branched-chain amino acid ABC transporter permease [Actinomycetota bacterium]MCZ6661878.1 branched-chain amino acid ABC transporter permease [Actinomycetota bacterium]
MRMGKYWQLVGPSLVVMGVAIAGTFTSNAIQLQFRSVLVTVAIVVSLHVFIGNSGVISFGHISFVAVGAFAAGISTAPADVKPGTFPDMLPFLATLEIGNIASLLLAAAVGAVFAFLVGIPLMRLSGLAAGIATFAVLIITNNVFRNWEAIGPGAKTLLLIPETTGFVQATAGLLMVMVVAFAYQQSRHGRMLRASREDPPAAKSSGVDIYRQRLGAFTLSGLLAGFAGGLLVHLLGSVTTQQVFLDLTFITLAMLVIGGIGSLWGAVVGALFIAGLNSILFNAENGIEIGIFELSLPRGTRLVTLGLVMLLVLLFQPEGITRGRELTWPFRARR